MRLSYDLATDEVFHWSKVSRRFTFANIRELNFHCKVFPNRYSLKGERGKGGKGQRGKGGKAEKQVGSSLLATFVSWVKKWNCESDTPPAIRITASARAGSGRDALGESRTYIHGMYFSFVVWASLRGSAACWHDARRSATGANTEESESVLLPRWQG